MKCPYCDSENTDIIESDTCSTKYICRDCDDDFIKWDDGEITDRHNVPIVYVIGTQPK